MTSTVPVSPQRADSSRLRLIMESTSEAIVSADSSGTIIDFNAAAEALFGCERDEVMGQPLTVLMPERFHGLHRQGLERFLATGRGRIIGRTVELWARKKDGSEVPVEFSLATWRADGQVFFTAFLRDVTERKRAEQQIQKAAARLDAANKELEAFSYSVSHDLRAPLRAINGFSRMLLEDFGTTLSDEARRRLQVIRDNAQFMGRLIDDLLNLSRLGRHEINKRQTDPGDLARQVIVDLRDECQGRLVEIHVGEMPACNADPALLRQVFANLLSNAIKYTGPRERTVIDIGCQFETDSGRPVYFVKDNGVGFDPRYADKLFGVFQRLHRAEEFEGTGVGLAIVQRIVTRHGGRVWAESEPDKGATFYFTLANGDGT